MLPVDGNLTEQDLQPVQTAKTAKANGRIFSVVEDSDVDSLASACFERMVQAFCVGVSLSPIGLGIASGSLEWTGVAALISFMAIALLFEHQILPS